jgi:ribosomal protein S18 acetylase RimI-like enzyme
MDNDHIRIREATPDDIPWLEGVVTHHFASPRVISRGRLHKVRDLPGLIAETDDDPVGLLLYREAGDDVEIVILISEIVRQGVASRLVEAMRQQAVSSGHHRLWLVTTNDNLEAIAFYRATGWQQTAVHRGAMHGARQLKPEIPEIGPSGLPIEDEIEFALEL